MTIALGVLMFTGIVLALVAVILMVRAKKSGQNWHDLLEAHPLAMTVLVLVAILIGGLIIHGLQPGPGLYRSNPEFVETILAAVLIANIVMLGVMYAATGFIARIASVPAFIVISMRRTSGCWIMGTDGASTSIICSRFLPCTRSRA